MTYDEFEQEAETFRREAQKDPAVRGHSFYVIERLEWIYRRCDADEREMFDRLLSDWVLSDDPSLRFDAVVLIDQLKVASAVPALQTLLKRLPTSSDPRVASEMKLVQRVLEESAGR